MLFRIAWVVNAYDKCSIYLWISMVVFVPFHSRRESTRFEVAWAPCQALKIIEMDATPLLAAGNWHQVADDEIFPSKGC